MGQLAFKGMKRLNRIQSIVFDTAYNTNENMLICAPTGAGKTNIAMLTVLHEIRQHFHQGVLKKNEFKVRISKSDSFESYRGYNKFSVLCNLGIHEDIYDSRSCVKNADWLTSLL